ncbi:MAG: hypothetical protein J6W76_00490 [Spirochaetales bacterium]|nr:hypothetical protein [Spirochaetales bacterium]
MINAAAQNIDAAKVFKNELKTSQDKAAFDNVVRQYGSVIKNTKGTKTALTFLFYNEKGELGEIVNFESNISKNEKNKSMLNIKNTKIYYKTITVNKDYDFIAYGFTRENGAFYRDTFNQYIWSDRRRSSYIRLSDKVGAWINIDGYFTKSKYSVLRNRFVCAYLPVEYFSQTEKRFPVIYMLDGQQIWDNADCAYKGWKVETALESLVAENKINSAIIVGIYNTASRTKEYAGWCDVLKEEKETAEATPLEYKLYAEEHAKMIIDDLIPFVEANLRVIPNKQNRYIAGSSYGAF